MRVVVCPDLVGSLSSLSAGRAMAAGWPQAQVAVVPVGEAGGGFVQAARDALGGRPGVTVVAVPGPGVGTGPIPYEATSEPLGRALAAALAGRPRTVLLDLVSHDVHDGGAGLVQGLGAARAALAGVDLVGVVPSDQRDRRLLGLRGITSVRGRAAGEDPVRLLSTDAALADLAERLGVPDGEGVGACGGVGLAVLALGGRISTGPELLLGGISGPADLVVTGCSTYDFASRGGGVVAAAAQLAERLLCPCLVLADEVAIGGREMRAMGVEAAYATGGGAGLNAEATAAELRQLAVRVGRSWRW